MLRPILPDCLCDPILEALDLAPHLVPDHAQSIEVDLVVACVRLWRPDHVPDATRREGEPRWCADDLIGVSVDVVAGMTNIDRFEPAEAPHQFGLEAPAPCSLIRAQRLRQFPIQQASDQILDVIVMPIDARHDIDVGAGRDDLRLRPSAPWADPRRLLFSEPVTRLDRDPA
jgi:hypothetical protein